VVGGSNPPPVSNYKPIVKKMAYSRRYKGKENCMKIVSFSITPEMNDMLIKAKKLGIFTSKSEILRYCFVRCLGEMLDDFEKFNNQEYVKVDDKCIRIIKPL